MSLQWQLSREVPEDTAVLGEKLFAPENSYRQIGDRFDELFPDESVFESMYDDRGRGAISPLLLALVTVFQMWERVPDRLAAQWVVSRMDWKYALHLALDYAGFHFTDLSAFRQRLMKNDQERLMFDQVLQRLKGLGLIKRRGKVRSDSTHLLGVVERLSQLELVTESIRVALKAVLAAAPEWATEQLPSSFCKAYEKRQREYGLGLDKVREKLLQAGHDGYWFLTQIDQSSLEAIQQLPEVAVLRTVLKQQFPSGSGGPPATGRPTGKGVIESPHEPQVRYGTKRGKGWLGYKGQVTESCDKQTPNLLLDLEPTGALDNDSPELPKIQARLEDQQIMPGEQYVDQGYMSGKHLVKSAAQGITLMGVLPADTQGPEGFRQTDFGIDVEKQRATCPAGKRNRVWSVGKDEQIQIRFNGKTCQQCDNFGKCTKSPQGRSLTLHPYRAALIERRAEAETDAFKKKLWLRSGIEGTISELVRGHEFRRARYRGEEKLRLQGYFTAVAVNLKRTTRWWAQLNAAAGAAN